MTYSEGFRPGGFNTGTGVITGNSPFAGIFTVPKFYAPDTLENKELGWKTAETFETGIEKTVRWFLNNQTWVGDVISGAYRTAYISTTRTDDGA